MKLSKVEVLSSHFYEWEKRGRGWRTFGEPVELEPVFIPFFPYRSSEPTVDDGKRPSYLGSIGALVERVLTKKPELQPEVSIYEDIDAYTFKSEELLRSFSISFSEGEKVKAKEIEKFLVMLAYCKTQTSFEIIADHTSIRIQLVCRESDVAFVESQVKAYFPECITQNQSDTIGNILNEQLCTAIFDFGLKEEFNRPLLLPDSFDVDPLTGVFGVLEQLREDERAVIQVLFKAAVNPWAASILNAVTNSDGSSFFLDAPEMPKLAMEKVATPLYAVVARAIGQSTSMEKAYTVAERVGTTIVHSSQSPSNSLITLSHTSYTYEMYVADVILRQSHKLGMLLSAKELSTFVHYPFTIRSKKLERDIQKTKAAPKIAEGHDFILGKNVHQGEERIPTLSASQRLKHMHVIGATGTGKSTLLQSCIVQDILLGNGIAVLDPHGDLIESILPYIPENRFQDVIIVDPADSDYPVGFNILTAHSEIEKEILASDLVAVFRRLSTSFGDQMHSVLANAILAFLENTEGGTLIDLRRFLIEKSFREQFLKNVSDPNIVYYWQKEYPLLKSSSIGPILTRLDSFLRPKLIRNMVAQKKSLDFEDILDSRKILFIKLSQGLIGNENSYLLGTFFVSKIYQAAMARQAQSKGERKNFFLYIDEFQNFITPSMSSILSGTRKYGLGCILAHQDMIQLQKQDIELASSVISNAGTRVCFRVGDIDAKRFEDGFSSFEAQDLQNLGVGQAIVRIERPEYDFNLATLELKDIEVEKAEVVKNAVVSLSREKYGTAREEVERTLEYLRGEHQPQEPQNTVEEIKPAELVIQEPKNKEEEKPQPVVEIPSLDEKQKAKTTESFARQKELSQHRYLQTLIKKMAESRGYKAIIEEPTPDGQGRVDVSLEKNGKRIACEIGVTTSKAWEVHNIEKCLAARYEVVIAVPVDKRAGEIMEQQIEKNLDPQFHSHVFVMEADALFHYLDTEVAKEASTETRMKGYRVKVEYDAVSEEEMKRKRESVTKFVAYSVKKKKDTK